MSERQVHQWFWAGCISMAVMVLVKLPAHAEHVDFTSQLKSQETKYKTPEDMFSMIPFIGQIPRTFLIGDGYHFKLSGQELRIDHMGTRSNSPAGKRNCLISLNFAAPTAFFGSSLELPLFHAESFHIADWERNSMGDYVLHLSKDSAVEHPTIGLKASARF